LSFQASQQHSVSDHLDAADELLARTTEPIPTSPEREIAGARRAESTDKRAFELARQRVVMGTGARCIDSQAQDNYSDTYTSSRRRYAPLGMRFFRHRGTTPIDRPVGIPRKAHRVCQVGTLEDAGVRATPQASRSLAVRALVVDRAEHFAKGVLQVTSRTQCHTGIVVLRIPRLK
jgi:hypothetical protein